MSDATWMRNLVHKQHMLFNNLPLSEQKSAEIKLQADKNPPLKLLWSNTKIGRRISALLFQRQRPDWDIELLQTGNWGWRWGKQAHTYNQSVY